MHMNLPNSFTEASIWSKFGLGHRLSVTDFRVLGKGHRSVRISDFVNGECFCPKFQLDVFLTLSSFRKEWPNITSKLRDRHDMFDFGIFGSPGFFALTCTFCWNWEKFEIWTWIHETKHAHANIDYVLFDVFTAQSILFVCWIHFPTI